jgi:hypothetical protein
VKLHIDVELDLPDGWELSGLWYEPYGNDPENKWTADACWKQVQDSDRAKTLMEAAAYGPTPQLAMERLPGVIRENIERLAKAYEDYKV